MRERRGTSHHLLEGDLAEGVERQPRLLHGVADSHGLEIAAVVNCCSVAIGIHLDERIAEIYTTFESVSQTLGHTARWNRTHSVVLFISLSIVFQLWWMSSIWGPIHWAEVLSV